VSVPPFQDLLICVGDILSGWLSGWGYLDPESLEQISESLCRGQSGRTSGAEQDGDKMKQSVGMEGRIDTVCPCQNTLHVP
jgi:hypothetical protein